MMKKIKLISFAFVLFIMLGFVFTKDMLFAEAEEDKLITVGDLTVTNVTTISDIEKVLGKSKIKTISAFGGYAYTFYTDDDYSNYLYVETDKKDKIISYGSVDKNYKVNGKNNRGETYTGENPEELKGHFYTDDDNKIIGGIYYNIGSNDPEELRDLFNTNYDKYSDEYLYGITKHSVSMINALSRTLNKKIDLLFDESVSTIILDNGYYSSYSSNIELGTEENVVFSKMKSYVLNPMHFAQLIKNNLDKDYIDNNIALFNYDLPSKKLYGYTISKESKDKMLKEYENRYFNTNFDIGMNERQVLYAINLLDDDMTEHEKALVLAQYAQEGHILSTTSSWPSSFNRLQLSDSEFNTNFTLLAQRAGLSCELLTNRQNEKTWNICNLDDEWTYIDVSKQEAPSFKPTPYQKINFNMIFESINTIAEKNLSSVYDFTGADETENIFDYTLFHNIYPSGKAEKIENYSSRVYYDVNYKYYEKSENKETKIYKENRKTGDQEVLVSALYSSDGTGLVKNDNYLYYIGTDGSLNSFNLKTSKSKQEISLDESEKKISGVFTGYDGYIYYAVYNEESQETQIIEFKKMTDWSELKIYIPDNNYKYKLKYIENQNSVSIVDAEPFGNETSISGELYIPDTINNKPVIGIGKLAFGHTYSTHNKYKFSGVFKAAKNLQYIGDHAFAYNNYLEGVELNDTLKSVGSYGFAYNGKISGTVKIPNNVTYVGDYAFSCGAKKLELGNGLKYIKQGTFYLDGLDITVFKVPEGIEYIGRYGIPNSKALFLPESLMQYSYSGGIEELFIKSKNVNYLSGSPYNGTYLPANSQTSQYADENNIPYTDITDLKETITFEWRSHEAWTGEKPFKLNYTIKPKYYFDETILEWSSSDSDVASVDDEGLITINSTGTTNIKLTTSNGGEAIFELTVKGLVMNYNTWQFNSLNETLKLTARYNGLDTEDISWSSSNDEIATVDQNGNVTPKQGGFVTITATSSAFGSTKCLIYISVPIEMSDGSKVYAGDLNKDGVIDKKDLEILKVYISNGNITSDQILLSDINGDGIVDSKDISQMEKIINNESFEVGEYKPITNVILDKDQISLAIGKNSKLNATITPNDTTDSKKLTWKSSNNTVATVDSEGNITAKANGTITITVTTSNGKSATCKVVVGTGKLDYIKGDINRDEVVDVKDAREVLYMAVGMRNITDEDLLIGDMNANKKMESGDAIEILRIYLRKE